MKYAFPLPTLFLLAACAAHSEPAASPQTAPTAADSGIPHPKTDSETQIRRLSVEIGRLQYRLDELENRIDRFETRHSSPAQNFAPPARTASPSADRAARSAQNLTQAQTHYRNGNYAAAIKILNSAESGGNGSETERKSMYLLLQSHYRQGNCESAINIANRYLSRFRTSPEAAEALYTVGRCQWTMQQRDIARATWRKLAATYPDSAAARRTARYLKY
ncbi:tetratricopeptide repeat protein [Neisseria leonii]|uniref:Outer membrane protein assembly factor BamD n=1 Tax=Neisseria leonii TaxID=2995413 RepID=A0A9X4IA35_9NEIS|nr:tetratricopeptide repeat protein [Neisseria sp. 51.81]MDD9326995.1 outer membrane protein assembly factor BamD [Neisseria sp. 51.81]